MEYTWFVIVAIVALIFLPPMLLFRPLINAIANRIAGKSADAEEVKLLKKRVETLEQSLSNMQHRLITVEDNGEFSKKLLEDAAKKATEKKS
ncbi:MAG TPA: hypothetical protein V6D22_05560 [Candidatus Obscuribacterales bacterium]